MAGHADPVQRQSAERRPRRNRNRVSMLDYERGVASGAAGDETWSKTSKPSKRRLPASHGS